MEGTRRLVKYYYCRKKKAQNPEGKRDRLTELPEPLLHHILSYLTMKDVIGTSVLSKKWRHVWTSVPCLNFSSPKKTPKYKEIPFISRALLLHKGPKISKLSITYEFSDVDGLHVDAWIHFALARNVNELCLQFLSTYAHSHYYKLPHFIFCGSSSLTVLALKGCELSFPTNSRTNFILRSLQVISLEKVSLYGDDINRFISSCPKLECLTLDKCSCRSLNLRISHTAMNTLKIQESDNCYTTSDLVVYAPFVASFELITSMSRSSYFFYEMGSLDNAILDCYGKARGQFYEEQKRCAIVKILDDLRHVKVLRLCSCYIQVLSSSEEQSLDFLSFDATFLGIKTGLTKWELPAISYMLRHSPNIETLIINICKIEAKKMSNGKSNCKFNCEVGETCELQESILVDELCVLKTVKIYNFLDNLDVEPNATVDELLAHLQNDMHFFRILLSNSKVLERLVIKTCKNANFGKSENKKLKVMLHLTQELLAFPRASRDAQIYFS